MNEDSVFGGTQEYDILKKALYLSVSVFSTKVPTGVTIFTFPAGEGTAILRGHPGHAKVQPLAGQR